MPRYDGCLPMCRSPAFSVDFVMETPTPWLGALVVTDRSSIHCHKMERSSDYASGRRRCKGGRFGLVCAIAGMRRA
jgi:hypothetical protein